MDKLKVAKVDRYDLVNSPHSDCAALTIWFSGCHFRCRGCHNKKLWDRESGRDYNTDKLAHDVLIEVSRLNIADVVLLGGEPLDQDICQLTRLCMLLHRHGVKIWLYTGYEFDDVPVVIKEYLHVMKCGRYIEELRNERGFPATLNQKIYKNTGTIWQMEDLA